jgi:hypothetical protein
LLLPGDHSVLSVGAVPPTSATAGTGIWLDRTGLYSLLAGTYQVKIDTTTGALTAGGGNVTLDVNGINITSNTSGINFDGTKFIHIINASGVLLESSIFFGYGAGNYYNPIWATAIGNIGIGISCLKNNTTGQYNTIVGSGAGNRNETGTNNVSLGYLSLYFNRFGDYNTSIGANTLYNSGTSLNGCVAIGYGAGYYADSNDRLFVDNQVRASAAECNANSLLYGVFAATAAGQSLTVNAGTLTVTGTITGTQLISNIATGTAPITVTSTTECTNLKAATVTGLTVTAAKTLTVSNSLTLTATDGSTLAIGTGGTLGTAAYTATGAYEASGAIATHAAVITGVHGLVITAGKTITVTDNSTINQNVSTAAHPSFHALHVSSAASPSDPGDNNLLVDGTATVTGNMGVGVASDGTFKLKVYDVNYTYFDNRANANIIRMANAGAPSAGGIEYTIGTSAPGIENAGDYWVICRYSGATWAQLLRVVGTGITIYGTLQVNGNTTLGDASTDTITNTGRAIFRTTASDPQHATAGSRPAGSVGEIAYYSGKMYFCTNAATPTWEKFTST